MAPKSSINEQEWIEIYRGIQEKKTIKCIADELGRPVTTLRSALTAKGLCFSRVYPDKLFEGIIETLDEDTTLSLGKLSRQRNIRIPVIIRYLRKQNRVDLCRRHRKNKGISKSLHRKEHFGEYSLVEEVVGPELGLVFQNRDSLEWVLSTPPHFLIGMTPNGLRPVKLKVNRGETVEEAFHREFMILRFIPTIETMADYWGISSRELEEYLDNHASKYFAAPESAQN